MLMGVADVSGLKQDLTVHPPLPASLTQVSLVVAQVPWDLWWVSAPRPRQSPSRLLLRHVCGPFHLQASLDFFL